MAIELDDGQPGGAGGSFTPWRAVAPGGVGPPGPPGRGSPPASTRVATAAWGEGSADESLLADDFFLRRDLPDDFGRAGPAQGRPTGDEGASAPGPTAWEGFRPSGPTGDTSGSARTLRLPDVGDEVFGFRLRQALGRGAFARVFLARQADLAGRPVVLKVSAIEGTEPQTLAQLQHTHIVPIYSVHEDPRGGLRAVCMPYLGGASLSDVLRTLFAANPRPRQGREFVAALGAASAPAAAGSGCHDSAALDTLTALASADYLRVAVGLTARLAEGLHHAHERGVLHRDVKPSNVLISDDGQPLLLDFNLALDQKADRAHAAVGGTVAYMAPEHLLALIGRSPEAAGRVDRRSDVYSLGLVLLEMLTGRNPFSHSNAGSSLPARIEAMAAERRDAVPSPRAVRPDVPWGLEGVVRHCLAADPDRRYQQADHLAEDLRRLLDDRPLRYAPELSRRELAGKWSRRHSRLTGVLAVSAVAVLSLLALAATLRVVNGHLAGTRDTLGRAEARDLLRAHDEATARALCLVNTLVDGRDHLRQGTAACERALALYDDPPADGAPPPQPEWRRLTPGDRRRVTEDRRELMLRLAAARCRLAPGDLGAVRAALRLLDRAERLPGVAPSRALWADRSDYLGRLGDAAGAEAARRRAEATPAVTAGDHYLLATSHARRGDPKAFELAVAELNRALRLDPRHYGSLIQRGACRLAQGEYALAAGDFGQCAGLRPEVGWGVFNRGYALDRAGRKVEAVEDYTTALGCDPEFTPALVNRGLARMELRRFAGALQDFDKACALGGGGPEVDADRGMALEGLGRYAEADSAFALALRPGGDGRPGQPSARLLWSYGFAVAARRPAAARAAFDEVLRGDPRHPQALYGRATLAAAGGGRDGAAEALGLLDRAAEADPGWTPTRRYRALLLARRGDWARAAIDINWCLEHDPQSGDTLYAAACVASLAADRLDTPGAAGRAVALLRQALARGVGRDKMAADPDLAAARDHPDYVRLAAPEPGTAAEPAAVMATATARATAPRPVGNP